MTLNEFRVLKRVISTGETYFVCSKNRFMDRKLMMFLASLGAKVKTGVLCAMDYDTIIFDDYIFQIY